LVRVNFLKELKTIWGKWIMNTIKTTVNNMGDKDNIIKELLNLKSFIYDIFEKCFNKNKIFKEEMRKSFENSINYKEKNNNIGVAELLARYLHDCLKKSPINVSIKEDEIEHTFNECIILFTYIAEKDMFETF
jgi:hypothetical protein